MHDENEIPLVSHISPGGSGLYVALMVDSTPEQTNKVHTALTHCIAVDAARHCELRGLEFFEVTPTEGTPVEETHRHLMIELEVPQPIAVTCIIGASLRGITPITCVGVIFAQPIDNMTEVREAILGFYQAMVAEGARLEYEHKRGFVISIPRTDPPDPDKPDISDALRFAGLDPALEQLNRPWAVPLFIQHYVSWVNHG